MKSTYLSLVAAALIVGVGGWVVASKNKSVSISLASPVPSAQETPAGTVQGIASSARTQSLSTASASTRLNEQIVSSSVTPSVTVSNPSAPFDQHHGLTFQQAMDQFRQSGYRFQFSNCRGTPGALIVKRNTPVMFDNRDPGRHDFKITSVTVTIPGYDFLVAGIPTLGTHFITCDGGGATVLTVVP